jgi:hypothetical protein
MYYGYALKNFASGDEGERKVATLKVRMKGKGRFNSSSTHKKHPRQRTNYNL